MKGKVFGYRLHFSCGRPVGGGDWAERLKTVKRSKIDDCGLLGAAAGGDFISMFDDGEKKMGW